MKKIINPNTPDFVDPSQLIGIDNYLGENPDNIKLIEQTILDNRAVLINAPTNSGKSTVVTDLFKKWVMNDGKRCYYLLPKLIQQHQFSKTYLKDFPVINGNASVEDKEEALLFGANITWQGFLLNKYDEGLTENDIVIVDEAHLLINNQSFICETKHLVRKLQQGKYKIVLMSGTPNFLALQDLFNSKILSFYFNNPPPRRIKPYIIERSLMSNVMQYIRSLDFTNDGMHIIRVNDKEKHHELSEWAIKSLNLSKSDIQIVNKDIADLRWIEDDYKYLVDYEAIQPEKKLLFTTIFSDEGINILNTNIKSIGIFYDPKLISSSQRCRDSVIQFCSRFRNLHKIDNYDNFSISLFLPKLSEGIESQDYFKVFSVQEKSAKFLIHQLADTRKNYGAKMVMQVLPELFDGSDPQGNLVIEVGDTFFQINRQGIYFNTKNQIDRFKSNEEFLMELSPYFTIESITNFELMPNRTDSKSLQTTMDDRLKSKIKYYRPLKNDPDTVISTVANNSQSAELKQMGAELQSITSNANNGIDCYNQRLILSLEAEALRLLFLKNINFPIDQFAGLLIRKRELHGKIKFLRFMLSREANINKSMNNLYFVSFYEPISDIVKDISQQYIGNGFFSKKEVKDWISGKVNYYLKTKQITPDMIIDEMFTTEQQRKMVDGKKVAYISFIKERSVIDVVSDFLFFNEQYYPSYKETVPIADKYIQKQQEFNDRQGEDRNQQKAQASDRLATKLGKARLEVEKTKIQLYNALKSNPEFQRKVKQIATDMIEAFSQFSRQKSDVLKKLDEAENKKEAA
jgi:hypothetical protein